jgi:hypothetical protein
VQRLNAPRHAPSSCRQPSPATIDVCHNISFIHSVFYTEYRLFDQGADVPVLLSTPTSCNVPIILGLGFIGEASAFCLYSFCYSLCWPHRPSHGFGKARALVPRYSCALVASQELPERPAEGRVVIQVTPPDGEFIALWHPQCDREQSLLSLEVSEGFATSVACSAAEAGHQLASARLALREPAGGGFDPTRMVVRVSVRYGRVAHGRPVCCDSRVSSQIANTVLTMRF